MTALSAARDVKIRAGRELAGDIMSASTIYSGGFVDIDTTSGTSAQGGRIKPLAATTARLFVGVAHEGDTGDSDGGADGRAIQQRVVGQDIEIYHAVTGVAGKWHVGQEVFVTTDGTLTLTDAQDARPFGWVTEHGSSTSCWVRMYRDPVHAQGAMRRDPLVVEVPLPDTAGVAYQAYLPFAGQVQKAYGIVTGAAASAGVSDVALTFRIRSRGTSAAATGTALSGGGITIESSNSVGKLKSAAGITGTNTFNEGDWLQVYATPGSTAPAAGTMSISIQAVLRQRLGT